jgi:hypothetical protein
MFKEKYKQTDMTQALNIKRNCWPRLFRHRNSFVLWVKRGVCNATRFLLITSVFLKVNAVSLWRITWLGKERKQEEVVIRV